MVKTNEQDVYANLHTIMDFIRYAMSRFEEANIFYGHGTTGPWDEALQLILPSLYLDINIKPELYHAKLLLDEKKLLLERIRLRTEERIPSAYITGETWFWNVPFYVNRNVLIPRSPLGELIDKGFAPWISADQNVHKILDIGTGSGCLACMCAFAFPDAQVDAIDISPEALHTAGKNIERLGLNKRVFLLKSDVFSDLGDRQYDIIISNPPYVDAKEMADLPPEYHYEPQLGLASGDDGLDCVREILAGAKKHLTRDGLLIVEVGFSGAALVEAYPDLPFIWVELQGGGEGVFILHASDL